MVDNVFHKRVGKLIDDREGQSTVVGSLPGLAQERHIPVKQHFLCVRICDFVDELLDCLNTAVPLRYLNAGTLSK
jgi:hypothetical protein